MLWLSYSCVLVMLSGGKEIYFGGTLPTYTVRIYKWIGTGNCRLLCFNGYHCKIQSCSEPILSSSTERAKVSETVNINTEHNIEHKHSWRRSVLTAKCAWMPRWRIPNIFLEIFLVVFAYRNMKHLAEGDNNKKTVQSAGINYISKETELVHTYESNRVS